MRAFRLSTPQFIIIIIIIILNFNLITGFLWSLEKK